MWAKLLGKIPSVATILGSKWFIGVVSAAAVGAAVWLYADGRHDGYRSGVSESTAKYEQQIEDVLTRELGERDAIWTRQTEEFYEEVREILEANARTEAGEVALRNEMQRLEEQLRRQENEIPELALGSCSLSDNFDRMFIEPSLDGTGDNSSDNP